MNTEVKKEAAPYEFAKALALAVLPEKMAEQISEKIVEQVIIGNLAAAVSGEEVRIEMTIKLEDGVPHGVQSKIVGASYEKMQDMSEEELVNAVIPTLVMKLKNEAAKSMLHGFDLTSMLQELMEDIEGQLDDDEGGAENPEDAPADKEQATS